MPRDKPLVINAENLVAGRLASVVAKMLLRGEEIIIVNAEKAVVVGHRKDVIDRFKRRLEWRTYYNPEKRGPKIPRSPDRILRRMVRGMLPWKSPRGKAAFKKLKVYIGVPEEYKNERFIDLLEARRKSDKVAALTLEEISKELGWHIYG